MLTFLPQCRACGILIVPEEDVPLSDIEAYGKALADAVRAHAATCKGAAA